MNGLNEYLDDIGARNREARGGILGAYARLFSVTGTSTIKTLLVEIQKAGKIPVDFTASGIGIGVMQENQAITLAQLVEPLKALAQTDSMLDLDAAERDVFAISHKEAIEKINSLACMRSGKEGDLVDFIERNPDIDLAAIAEINQPFPANLETLAILALAKVTDNVVAPERLQRALQELTEAGNFAFIKSTIAPLIEAKKLDAAAWSEMMSPYLMARAMKGDNKEVRDLLEAHVSPDPQDGGGFRALMFACERGHSDIVQALLDAGANLDAQDGGGKTVLMIACESGQVDIVQALLRGGADTGLKDNYGQTALMYACAKDQVDIVQALLRGGADATLKDNYGYTALDRAENSPTIKQILTVYTATMPQGATAVALCNAQAMHATGLASIIDGLSLSAYIASMREEWEGEMPGVIDATELASMQAGYLERIEEGYFVESSNFTLVQIEITAMIESGRLDAAVWEKAMGQQLILRAQEGQLNKIRFLHAAGVKPNVQDAAGRTALIEACKRGRVDIVQALLAAGADTTLKDNDGKTALDYAQDNAEIVRMLTAHPATMPEGAAATATALYNAHIAPAGSASTAMAPASAAP